MRKKVLALTLVVIIFFFFLPAGAFAEKQTTVDYKIESKEKTVVFAVDKKSYMVGILFKRMLLRILRIRIMVVGEQWYRLPLLHLH